MTNVVPMRRPKSELFDSYRNMRRSPELASPIGLALTMLLFLSASVSVFGLTFLGVLAMTTMLGAGIGSTIHFKVPYRVPLCISSLESERALSQDEIPKAA